MDRFKFAFAVAPFLSFSFAAAANAQSSEQSSPSLQIPALTKRTDLVLVPALVKTKAGEGALRACPLYRQDGALLGTPDGPRDLGSRPGRLENWGLQATGGVRTERKRLVTPVGFCVDRTAARLISTARTCSRLATRVLDKTGDNLRVPSKLRPTRLFVDA